MTTLSLLSTTWRTDEATGGYRWRANIRALHQYWRRDMRDAREERQRLYPKNHVHHVQRTVPLVWSLCREMATAYVEGAARRYVALTPSGDRGADVSGSVLETIQRIYRGAQIDSRMHTANEHLVALNNAVVHVWPLPVVGGVRVLLIPPHDQEIEMTDASSTDERDIRVLRFVMPVGTTAEGVVEFGVGEITPTTAMWIEGPDRVRGKGIWTGTDDVVHRIGRVPVVVLRGSDPGPGEFWAPAPEDLLDAQRAVNHDLTDVGHVARMQGYSQPVALGITSEAAKELQVGPETTLGLRGEGVDFKFVSPAPDLEGYVNQNQRYLETVVATQGMNPATYMRSAGITALAKQIEIMDRNGARKRHLRELRRAEQRLYDLVRLTVNSQRGAILPDAEVEVEYREPVMPVDRLHDAQALVIECDKGLNSWARERARRDGVSLAEGQRRVEEDLRLNATRSPLNGAQVAEVRELLIAAGAGQIPVESARAAIASAFPIPPEDVDAMIAPLVGFEAAATQPAPQTQTPPPVVP